MLGTKSFQNMTPKIFISGINQDLQLSSTLTKDFACSGPFVIGFKYFSGTIDEVRIWSHQLSAKNISEVSSLDSPTNLEKTINNFQKVLDKSKSSTAHTSSSTDLQNKNFQAAGFTLNKYLIELSQNTHKWQVYSEKTLTAIEQHKQDTELPLFRFVTTNLQGAKLELIETLKTRAHMRFLGKEALKDERFKDLKIRKLDKDFITFSTITPYGMVLNRYYLDEPASQAALEALVKQAIIYTPQIFKDSPQSLLAAMIISKGKAYSQLAKSISDQRYRKMLKRVSMELQP